VSIQPRNLSVDVVFNFGDGDVLMLTELSASVHVINSLSFSCDPNRPMKYLTTATAGTTPICDFVSTCSSNQYQTAVSEDITDHA
jgi:hypothetical protein